MTATDQLEHTRPDDDAAASIWPPDSARPRWDRWMEKVTAESAITFVIVAAAALLVFWQLEPSQMFKNTTPAGGDMGAHVWLPAYVKRALLPNLRLTGWTPDWYNGFPALTYYFPLPIVAIALLSYVHFIGYDVSFKIIASIGLITLPISGWAFARLARMRFPMPAIFALATLPFIFSREFTIYGGNIASTMAGEFCFSISLSFAFLFLGLFARGLQDGKHRASSAVILACCGLSHILPLFFALGGAVVMLLMKIAVTRDWRRLRFGLPALITGGLLIGFWALPFYWRLPFTTNMGYQKVTNYVYSLSHKDTVLIGLAIAGFVIACARFNWVGVWLGLMAFFSALVFRLAPQATLWNARFLPFWFLCLYLLVGILVMEVGMMLVEVIAPRPPAQMIGHPGLRGVPILALLGFGIFVLYPIPRPHHTTDWFGQTPTSSSYIPDWVYWNYSGYENPAKVREKEYFDLIAEMSRIGHRDGCGQALWEYEPAENDFGTPDALMLLPYWTNGCIGSEEGLYYESSATTPYHFLNVAEVSDQPSNPVRGLDYPTGPNVPEAVSHMQIMGDKYLMADTKDVEQAANADPDLRLVGTVGPYPVNIGSGTSSASQPQLLSWDIYEVSQGTTNSTEPSVVVPLVNQPVVLKNVQSRNPQVWLDASQSWYLNPDDWDVYEAASGPSNWTRVSPDATNLPVTPEPAAHVTNVVKGNESISFDVDQTGVPILVKESYFPNWQVHGASGVYRITPDLMVVVPDSTHVELYYGYTPVDWIGLIMSMIGLGTVGFMWKASPVAYATETRRRRRAYMWTPVDDDGNPIHPTRSTGRWFGGGGLDEDGKVPGRMAPPDLDYLDRIFKAYDIRGTVPDQMNADLARAVGDSFARFTGAPRLLVARDMRPSGPDLVHAFAEGATAAGADVIDLGLCSTDEMYFASGNRDAPGAMFTASHNPAQYNGIKLCRSGARPIGADTGLDQIKASVVSYLRVGPPPGQGPPGRVTRSEVLHDYATKVRSFVDVRSLRPLRVIADTANGMGGLVVPAVFASLPFDLEILFQELDGTFPNHPADPIQPENLRDLQQRIRETGADVGLAFDGDADRCFLVDDQGVPLSGSTTTALVAAAMLDKQPGSTILYNLICSKAVPEIIRERGGTPVRTRVGHSYIKAIMADTDALFGGEHSGHYYFRDNYRADSGAIAALVVLEVLSKQGRPLSVIRREFERYADSGEINTEVSDQTAVIEEVAAHYAAAGARTDRLDGLTVDLGDWWFNLRPSNTEPLLRLNLEASDRESCDAHTAEVLALFTTEKKA